jgi:hypothetical protein
VCPEVFCLSGGVNAAGGRLPGAQYRAAVGGVCLGMAEWGVRVLGEGIAASCCTQLLRKHGGFVARGDAGVGNRVTLPAILVSQSTQKLLADIFESSDLFEGLPEIRKRVVAWGKGEPVMLPHSAVVVSEGVLLERLRARMADVNKWAVDRGVAGPDSTIVTARAPRDSAEQMHFGSRMALVSEVELREEAEQDACWVEAVEEGWLFLLATGGGRGSLICVGGAVEELLAKSRLVSGQVKKMCGALAEFAAYPRTAVDLCGAGWLACGSAAMTFDPLCGEGAGNAAREAILACAVVRAIAGGGSVREILAEYSLRLRLGFLRHLENCREFYQRDRAGAFWNSELNSIERGIVWTQEKLRGAGRPRFRLVGYELERIAKEEKI